jgi:PAS domain S-box-containing protein
MDRQPERQGFISKIHTQHSELHQKKNIVFPLNKNEEYFRAISENSIAGTFIIHEGHLVYTNSAFAELIGYGREDLIGTDPLLYICPEDKTISQQFVQPWSDHVLKNILYECRIIHKNGEPLSVGILISHADINGQTVIIGIVINIAECKKYKTTLSLERDEALQMLDNTGVIVVFLDTNGIVKLINKRGYEILGYRDDEIIGTKWTDKIVPARTAREIDNKLQKILTGDSSQYGFFEYLVLNKQGQERIIAWRSSLVKDKSGALVGILNSGEDITDYRHSQEALKESERKHRDLIDNIPVGIMVTSSSGQVLEVNRALVEMFAYPSKEEFVSLFDINDFFSLKDRKNWATLLETEGKVDNYEARTRKKDGNTFWISLTSIPRITEVGDNQTITIVQNITRRKETEARLKESEGKYQAFFEYNIDAILITSPYTLIHVANGEACKMFGMSEQEIIYGGMAQLIDISNNKFKTAMEERNRLGFFRGELEFKRKDQSIFIADVSSAIFYNRFGIKSAMFTIRDISKRKKAEEALQQSYKELTLLSERLMSIAEEERKNIAQEIHDELGQSLTALKIELTWLSKRLPIVEEGIVERSQRMNRILDHTIQNVQKLSASLRPNILDNLGLFAAIEWLSRGFERSTGIGCFLNLPEENYDFDESTANHIFRICQESLTNIARHSGATKVSIKVQISDDIFSIEIHDNGRGIEDEEIRSLQSFGLISMRERTRQINGDLNIKGERGEGTTLTLKVSRIHGTKR